MIKRRNLTLVVVFFLIILLAGCDQNKPRRLYYYDAKISGLNLNLIYYSDWIRDYIADNFEPAFTFPEFYHLEDKQTLPQPLLVVVENHPRSWPHSGLEEADVIYEVLAEGGITRLLALYVEDVPEEIGPVRSAREYLAQISADHQALLFHAGASPSGYARLSASDVDNIDEISNSKYYWRDKERDRPHNLYTGRGKIFDHLMLQDRITDGSSYKFRIISQGNEPQAELADEINVYYWGNYLVTYVFNSEENNYLRYMQKKPHVNAKGDQLKAENILIIRASTDVIDSVGRLAVDLYNGGEMKLIKSGKSIDGYWRRENGRIKIFDEKDNELFLNSGKTWIQIIPDSVRLGFNENILKEDYDG